MEELKFNYAYPYYKKIEGSDNEWHLPVSGAAMKVGTLKDIKPMNKDGAEIKAANPWMQFFDNGFRISSDNVNESLWNGVTAIDVDSKLFYKNCKRFDVNKTYGALWEYFDEFCSNNFLAMQLSTSKTSFHMLFYWDCERTILNYKKCAILSRKIVHDAFVSIGRRDIIDFKFGKSKVLDTCTQSIYQGIYSSEEWEVADYLKNDQFGYVEGLDEITIEDAFDITNSSNIPTQIDGKDSFTFIERKEIDKDEIQYKPHHIRRCIYEALILVFKDKTKVDEEWSNIAGILPEENGHNTKFYGKEPDRNKWYKRFKDTGKINIHILDQFGYTFECKNDYIYKDWFAKNWRSSIKNEITEIYSKDSKHNEKVKSYVDQAERELLKNNKRASSKMIENVREKAEKEIRKKIADELIDKGIFSDDVLDEELEESTKKRISELQQDYFKNRFDATKDFRRCIGNYDLEKDASAYKMYADMYYRDENNMPSIKYDILEDNILFYGFDKEFRKRKETTFIFSDEYTHWHNHDAYSNKMSETLYRDAVSKYVTRWHGFNIIHDYLESLKNHETNEEALETFLIRHLGADDTPLNRVMTKNFFIAAIKKQLCDNPERFVFPHILFLQGPTNNNKTFLLTTMFTIYGRQLILNKIDPQAEDKNIAPLVSKNWMIQFGEGGSLKKVDVNIQKEFVDRINLGLKYQKKFANEQTTVYPRVVITKTSNEDTLFNDVSIDEGDKRNWLIVCKNPAYSSTVENRKLIEEEKDLIWATALKIYLENPDIDLELDGEMFRKLNEIQEDFKLIKNNDVEEIYNKYFDRDYILNEKGEFIDERNFIEQAERGEEMLQTVYGISNPDPFDTTQYNVRTHIKRIPSRWISNAIAKEPYGINLKKKLWRHLESKGWKVNKVCIYKGKSTKCISCE